MYISKFSNRSFQIETNGKIFTTPFFFPSISSIKTNFKIEQYLDIIQKIGYSAFLISSYDIDRYDINSALLKNVSSATHNGTISLLDSGHYEAYWYQDTEWSIEKYGIILKKINVDFCFSYDVFWENGKTIKKHLDDTITSIAISAGMLKSGETIPLLHLPTPKLLDTIPKIVQTVNPKIIGIPERELGANLFERASNVKKIRELLDSTDQTVLLHLLGTGNPISILIYSMCGADMFDGLEWCQTVVNPKTGHLFHFVQKELLDCNCDYCESDLSYPLQTLGHNLRFMRYFMDSIQQSMKEKNTQKLIEKYLEKTNIRKLNAIGVFE
jgi:queuine/archaeosine tRNA-ribosyltransferase